MSNTNRSTTESSLPEIIEYGKLVQKIYAGDEDRMKEFNEWSEGDKKVKLKRLEITNKNEDNIPKDIQVFEEDGKKYCYYGGIHSKKKPIKYDEGNFLTKDVFQHIDNNENSIKKTILSDCAEQEKQQEKHEKNAKPKHLNNENKVRFEKSNKKRNWFQKTFKKFKNFFRDDERTVKVINDQTVQNLNDVNKKTELAK